MSSSWCAPVVLAHLEVQEPITRITYGGCQRLFFDIHVKCVEVEAYVISIDQVAQLKGLLSCINLENSFGLGRLMANGRSSMI
jgi:hypothetical protein